MNDPSHEAALAQARHAMAVAVLSAEHAIPSNLGAVTLHPHQRVAAGRIAARIESHGGVMLADPVGVGKTYVALAIAKRYPSTVILAPAALRDMWRGALEATGIAAQLVTHESLSRRGPIVTGASNEGQPLVVIDEAHRFRSIGARRYAAAAEMCRRAHVLLLTATPIQNHGRDLAAQLALFLGRDAWSSSPDALAEHVVRTNHSADMPALPAVSGPHRLRIPTDDDCVDEIVQLPSPVPALDEGTAAVLATYTLVHQWASSRAALVAALKRGRARALALAAAIDEGRVPTRGELSAWTYADDTMQLAFPWLVASAPSVDLVDHAETRASLDRYAAAVTALLDRLRASQDPDADRATLVAEVCARHVGARVIAFTQYAETVATLFRSLSRRPGVAALTAHGARVAGGPIKRNDILAQFGLAGARGRERDAERIDLLLTTDLLSEGMNMQQASVVVHLDLPWNPARLDQRVGRARRLGSPFEVVTVYTMAPPASADRLLRLEERLRKKLCVAQQTVGLAGRILPPVFGAQPEPRAGAAEDLSGAHQVLRRWLTAGTVRDDGVAIGAVTSAHGGFLAAVVTDGAARLVVGGRRSGAIETTPRAVRAAVDAADGDATTIDQAALEHAMDRLARWLNEQRGAAAIDLSAASGARARRETLVRVGRAMSRTPRHRRAIVAPLADEARLVATAPLAEGAERVLGTLARADLPDEAWLRSIAAFGKLNVRTRPRAGDDGRVVAVILLLADRPKSAS